MPFASEASLTVQLVLMLTVAIAAALVVDLLLLPVRWWFARRSHFPRVADGMRLIRLPVALTFILVGFGVTLQHAGVDGLLWFVLRGLLATIGIAAWTWATFRGLSLARASLLDNQDRWAFAQPQVLSLLDVAVRAVATLVASYAVLLAWSIDLTAWLAGAGVVGIAVGFAAKDILSNLIGGVTIIIEAPYKLGDRVEVSSGINGLVTYIGLRSTWLETRDGKSVVVPNADMMNSTVINLSAGPTPYCRTEVVVPVPFGPDPEEVVALLLEAVRRSKGVALDDPARQPTASPIALSETSVSYQLRFWTLSPGSAKRAVITNAYRLLRAAGVRFRAAMEEVAPRASDRPEVSGPLKRLSAEAIDALLLQEKPRGLTRTLVLSDLHLGDGGHQDVFAGAEALPALLERLSAEASLRVILNGNTLDFLSGDSGGAERARRLVAAPATAAALQALGRVLEGGGEVILRTGTHDTELLQPEVQGVIRGALGQPQEVAERLILESDASARLLEVEGARVAVTHGHQRDGFTRVDYDRLSSGDYRDPPGVALARDVLSPLSREHQLRFVDLLRPDYQGAALAALAVAPEAVKAIYKGGTRKLMWQFFRRSAVGALSFAAGDDEPAEQDSGVSDRVEDSALTDEETAAMAALLEGGPMSFASGDDEGQEAAGRARVKLLRSGVQLYAKSREAVDGGAPIGRAEWKEARRQATLHQAVAVLGGHTQVAGARQSDKLVYLNTGTWSWQLQAPGSDASLEDWSRFLRALQINPELDADETSVFARFTAALVEPHPEGGAAVKLVEWKDQHLTVLEERRLTP